MTKRFGLDEIRQFWTEQVQEHRESPVASWSDVSVIEMEIAEVAKYLADGDRVLDAGCANGYSTVHLAARRQIQIRGVDYIPEMIDFARERLEQVAGSLQGSVEFDVGDITDLQEEPASYDKVVVIRVIINLAERDRQVQGLRECARVLKPGGLLLCSEATVDGWESLNRFRGEWGLPPIPMPPFNLYVDQRELADAVSSELELVDVVNFASTYYVGSRVLKPLLIQALGADINVADPNMQWNRWFSQLPAAGDYGVQKLLVFRKR